MGNIANIITYKGRFYIQEEQFDRVFIYDDTGRCLKKIDNKGRGPGEYLRIESIDINTEKEELMLVDGMSDKLFFYDLDGNFKSIHSIRYFQTENTLYLLLLKILEMRDYMDMLWYCQKVMKIFLKGIVIYLFK